MTTALGHRARMLFAAACAAADPARALDAALGRHPVPALGAGGRYVVVAVGKAAVAMAKAMMAHLAPAPVEALVVTNRENLRDLPGATVVIAGHPVPDQNSVAAAAAVIALLGSADQNDRVIALISGGGSALLTAPARDLRLSDKIEVNRLLLERGLDIRAMNLIRQHLSRLKGGGLLQFAAPAPVTAYILSDVIGDDLAVVASGPTVTRIGTIDEARALIEARGLWLHLPEAVRGHLGRSAMNDPAPGPEAQNHLIGSNRISLEAVAAAAADLAPVIVSDALIGDVADAAVQIVEAAQTAAPDRAACLIFGGETVVNVTGSGIGGRNQELALRVALAMPDLGRNWVFLSAGTDGRDGPTDAAGGVVDAGTVDRIRASGANPETLLMNNDSHAALKAAGDLLITGGTGTNVADVQILLLGSRTGAQSQQTKLHQERLT